jgi:hypothetical protein
MSLDHLELISFPLLHPLLLTPLQSRPLHTVPIVIILLFMILRIFLLLFALFPPLHLVVRSASVGKDLSRASSLGLVVEAVATIGEREVVVFLLDRRLRVERVLVVNCERVRMETLLEDWVCEKCL